MTGSSYAVVLIVLSKYGTHETHTRYASTINRRVVVVGEEDWDRAKGLQPESVTYIGPVLINNRKYFESLIREPTNVG